ncbi:uncharacterized protein DSM5745_09931 [Aspergillus mulundensis]|uniref:Uncharacterized protein n=1 Tax=Aspergillus mulundensis TaxID=1810919 RepID=A0A3D8QS97_9EURO|nr:Uncharacterized protein DSM5745_09931 [Aspergillus mulundensis]RDW64520.1 Uncharacterized protein DSM5745_09931 [Aspergillus mulundensis]
MARTYPHDKAVMQDHPPAYTEATAPGRGPGPALARTPSSTLSTPATPSLSSTPRSIRKGHATSFAMLSLCDSDKLRFIRFPEPLTALASEVLTALWPKGIQTVQKYDESLEFKLKGNPLGYGGDKEKIAIRVTLMGLLDAFAKEGWVVVPSAGGRVSRMGDYKSYGQGDSLIFHRQQPQVHSWLCISFDSSDLIHLLNAPTELATSLISSFGDRIEKCNKDFVSGTFELKVRGNPWTRNSGKGAVQSRLLALDLMQILEEQGYSMATALDIDHGDGGSEYESSGEVWFWYR